MPTAAAILPVATRTSLGRQLQSRKWVRQYELAAASRSRHATIRSTLGSRQPYAAINSVSKSMGSRCPGPPRPGGFSEPGAAAVRFSCAASARPAEGEARGPVIPVSLRLGLFYAVYFGTMGIRLPYWPVWMAEVQGLSNYQIGALMGGIQIARTAAGPIVGLISDAMKAPRLLAGILGVACTCLYVQMTGVMAPRTLIIMACLAGAMWSAVLPLGEALAVNSIPSSEYGRVRLWGSVAFMLSNILGGQILTAAGTPAIIMVLMACGAFLVTLSALALPRLSLVESTEQQAGDKERSGGFGATLQEAMSLVTSPVFLMFLLTGSCLTAAHSTYYSFGTIILQEASHSGSVVGLLWGVGVAAEVIVFAWKGLQKSLQAWQLLSLSAVASIVRWGVMATGPGLPLLVGMQLLHAFTFGAAHLGTIKFLQAAIPAEISATAYALFLAVSDGVFSAMGSYSAGHLYTSYGQSSYFAMSAFAAAGLCLSFLLGNSWDGRKLNLGSPPIDEQIRMTEA